MATAARGAIVNSIRLLLYRRPPRLAVMAIESRRAVHCQFRSRLFAKLISTKVPVLGIHLTWFSEEF
jgi:hypothetical protein